MPNRVVPAIQRIVLDVTCSGAGAADETSTEKATGRLLEIHYDADGAGGNPLLSTADFDITRPRDDLDLWNQSNQGGSDVTVFPTVAVHDQNGVAQSERDFIHFQNDPVRVVIAQGGDSTKGRFIFLFG